MFREQGITIVSVLTAIGMIVGVIVETIIPTGSTAPPKPPEHRRVESQTDEKTAA